jgi:hypothetical protein
MKKNQEKKVKNKSKSPLSIGADLSGFRFRSVTTLDWLQLHSVGTLEKSLKFSTIDKLQSTSVFKKLYEVWDEKYYIASIVSEPIEDFLPPDMNLIKLINRELYYGKPVEKLIAISLDHKLIPYQPSRIDFSIDFNTFINNYKPTTLIKDYVNNKILKMGAKQGYINFSNKKLFISNAIKFKNKESKISVNLYNKSLEMREVKRKPWIEQSWKDGGLDITQDVWRLEFAIHMPKFSYLNQDTGEQGVFDYKQLDGKAYLNNIIMVLISKYFDFRRNTGIKDMSDMPKVKLFPHIDCCKIAFERCNCLESDLRDQKFLKSLKKLNIEVREINQGLSESAANLIHYYKKSRNI